MTRRGWSILIAIAAVAILAAIVIAVIVSNDAEPAPAQSAGPSPTVAVTASAPPSPSLTPVDAPLEVSCETISTAAFQAQAAANGWTSWQTQDEQIGARPFDGFAAGSPQGAIVCRWGASPDLATDNVMDLAWAPIDESAAADAQQSLEADGYTRIEAPEGVYLALNGAGDGMDAEGYGSSYLFTDDDVRWAMTKADLAFVKAPDEAG